MSGLPAEIRERAAAVELLILDVDGVLTDGRLNYGADGELFKSFDAKDGLGLRLLMNEGVKVAVISARRSPPLVKRLADLKITHPYLGRDDKLKALDELLVEVNVPLEQVAFVGDDVLDLAVLRRVGLGITVADGHAMVREEAAWVTSAPGGHGAVREISDAILEARGRLQAAVEELLTVHVGKGVLDKV